MARVAEAVDQAGGANVIEIREVLAAAYLGPNKGPWTGHRMLTHAVEVDEEGRELRVLCGRVLLESLADAGSLSPGERHGVPTCPQCAAKVRRRANAP